MTKLFTKFILVEGLTCAYSFPHNLNMTNTQTVSTLNALTFDQIEGAYSGRAGKCCCGCSGKHYRKDATANDVRRSIVF